MLQAKSKYAIKTIEKIHNSERTLSEIEDEVNTNNPIKNIILDRYQPLQIKQLMITLSSSEKKKYL